MAVSKQLEFMVVVSMTIPSAAGGGRKRLGIDADWADGKSLYVKSVSAGAIEDWNRERPGEAIRAGDRVVAVNGVAGDAQAMVQECKEKLTLQLLVRRTEAPGSPAASPEPAPAPAASPQRPGAPAWAPSSAADMLHHMRQQQAARESATGGRAAEARRPAGGGYEPPDYYGALGVGSSADEPEVKRSYRKLVLQWHPDKHPKDRSQADEKIRQINNAYETLSNPLKRSAYDQMLAAMERRRTGVKLDVSFIKPRVSIPKEFMLCPLGHPDKFVRVVGDDRLCVQARDEVPGTPFRDFFAAARFSLWWLPEVNNMCRLRVQASAASGVEGGSHLAFGQSGDFADKREAAVAVSSTQDVKQNNVIAQASPFSAGAYRFEGAFWPGRLLTFRPPADLLMAKAGDDGGDDIVDFLLVDFSAAYKYMTMSEVLAEAVEKQNVVNTSGGYVKLGDLRADLNIRLYFQQNLGSAVWNNKDFETFFEGHYEQWDFDQKRARVRLRPKEEQQQQLTQPKSQGDSTPRSAQEGASADLLIVAETQAEVIRASLAASPEDLGGLSLPVLVRALERLAETPYLLGPLSVDVRQLAAARSKLLATLPERCDAALTASTRDLGAAVLPFPALASLHKAAAAIRDGEEANGEVVTDCKHAISKLAMVAGKRVAGNPSGVDWERLSDLLAMPLDWEAVTEPLRGALSSHLRRKSSTEPGAFVHAIRALAAAGRAARGITEELARHEFGAFDRMEGQTVAEVLLAVAESGALLREVAERLKPPLLHRLPLPELVEIVAILGERGYGKKVRSALQTRVAVAGPGLAAVPPHSLLRLATAATHCPVIAECALGPVAMAAASVLHLWPLEGIPELMLVAATTTSPAASSGARRLFSRAAEAVMPRLHELQPAQLLRTVVAAGAAAAHCRPLLEAASHAATAALEAFVPEQVVLLTQGSLALGGQHPAMVRLLDFWVVYFNALVENSADRADGQPDSGLPADEVAQLVRLLVLVAPGHEAVFGAAGARLRKVVGQLSSSGRSSILEAFPGGTGPAFEGKEELLRAVVEAEASSAENAASARTAEEAASAEEATATAEAEAEAAAAAEAEAAASAAAAPSSSGRDRRRRDAGSRERSRSRSGARLRKSGGGEEKEREKEKEAEGESAKPPPEEKRGEGRKRSRDRDRRRRRDDEDESCRMVE